MVARLQKTQDGYSIPLTAEMVEQLRLSEGAAVEVHAVSDDAVSGTPVEYLPGAEALEIYERSKGRFGQAYEALAK